MQKFNYYRAFGALEDRNKIPRKIKKAILGTKLNKSKLRLLLKSVVIIDEAKTMYETPTILPKTFCPFCGCESYYGSGNLTYYPEHWEKFRCVRCHKLVGYIDNSAFVHALECAYNGYDPSF